jgi:hypothetical protein
MKLIERGTDRIAFSLTSREKGFLQRLVEFYPVQPEPTASLSRSDDARLAEAGALLREALKEQNRELVGWLKAQLCEGQAWARSGAGWRLELDATDVERLLQVLNELRVGAWVRLGSPEDPGDEGLAGASGEAPWHAIMTMAGQFEMVLVAAWDAGMGQGSGKP